MMTRFRVAGLVLCANVIIPIAILIFARGFFPYKPFIPGLAQYEKLEFDEVPSAPFDRLIFMVVDALRSDFVYAEESGFKYTQSLIRTGSAIPFTAYARSPTVTMPRLKAITTGSIPSFLDAILNVDEGDTTSSLAAQDTWLAQMKAKGTGNLVLYGDDTWLKLFPETFDRHDGTSSFFVADFTEVDHNVTRNVAGELKNADWNTMILHYLGLDHIGHKSGPRSSNMFPKQQEMDGIVETLYESMQTEKHLSSTLLVLCGDHGMNDAGNHGASSAGETSPALLFISPKLQSISAHPLSPVPFKDDFRYYSTVEQSDLAPTLAGLLGFPVPQNNLGAFIPDFLPLWDKKSDQVQLLVRNARQIIGVAAAAFGGELFDDKSALDPCVDVSSDTHRLACDWRSISAELASVSSYEDISPQWIDKITEWLRSAQGLMSNMASNYDMRDLALAQVILAVACLLSTAALARLGGPKRVSLLPFMFVTTMYGIMMFASSYVEEEHHFWYWSTTAWISFLVVKYWNRHTTLENCARFLTAMAATRLVRGWNQTGQKFAGEPDIVKSFMTTYPRLLWLIVMISYIWLQGRLMRRLNQIAPTWVSVPSVVALMWAAFSFKLAFTNEDSPELVVSPMSDLHAILPGLALITRARLVFASATAITAYALFISLRGGRGAKPGFELLHYLYTVIALTQSRVTNIPLFLLHAVQFRFLQSTPLSVADIAVSSLLLQHMSYFAFGGTNAMSSVDLSSAYNGVSGFNAVAVGVLTFVSNWAAPIYWSFATARLLLQNGEQSQAPLEKRVGELQKKGANQVEEEDETVSPLTRYLAFLTAFVSWSVLFVMVACTVLRTHLFIWTVFSPKYLYCIAWGLGQHLGVNVTLGSLLFWLGTRSRGH